VTSTFTDQLAVLDDAAGSGAVIPFGATDGEGVEWRYTGLPGWDSPDVTEFAEQRTGADGMWDALNYAGGRIVTIDGHMKAPTAAALDAAIDRLAGAVPIRGRMVTLTVQESTPKQISARRSGRLMTNKLTDVVAEYSVALLAPDARKYQVDQQTVYASLGDAGGGVTLPTTLPLVLPPRDPGGEFFAAVNAGEYETPPLIRIAGPGRNLGIANLRTGQALVYPFELLTGDELVIDTAVGTAAINGTAYRAPSAGSSVVARFLLPPGRNDMQMLGTRTVAGLTPLLTMTWRSAWI
jgi:hypothetical protein